MIKDLKVWLSNKANVLGIIYLAWILFMLGYIAVVVIDPRSNLSHIMAGVFAFGVVVNLLIFMRLKNENPGSFDRNIQFGSKNENPGSFDRNIRE